MRTNSKLWWLLKPVVVVFIVQEVIFFYEMFNDKTKTESNIQTRVHIKENIKAPEKNLSLKHVKSNRSSLLGQIATMGRQFKENQARCSNIIKGDNAEITKGKQIAVEKMPMPSSNFAMVMQMKHSCDKFMSRRGYIRDHMTEEEMDFPIAYSIVVFKHFHQIEALLRMIYRPQNFYCIHVDSSSHTHLHAAARAYADCFPNVVVPRDVIDVVWGEITVLTAEFVCLYELLKYKWKYFINLTGQDYPLKTNRQIVKILKAFNGANDVMVQPKIDQGPGFLARYTPKGSPPHGLKIVRGSRYVILSRQFVEFVVSDERVRDFVDYLYDTRLPEEVFWATINNDVSLKAPGGFQGTLDEAISKPSNARVRWHLGRHRSCQGRYANGVCVFGVGDLQTITKHTALFASKFFWDSQPVALRCLREWMLARTRDEYLGLYTFDATNYSKLPNTLQANRR